MVSWAIWSAGDDVKEEKRLDWPASGRELAKQAMELWQAGDKHIAAALSGLYGPKRASVTLLLTFIVAVKGASHGFVLDDTTQFAGAAPSLSFIYY